MKWLPAVIVVAAIAVLIFVSSHGPSTDKSEGTEQQASTPAGGPQPGAQSQGQGAAHATPADPHAAAAKPDAHASQAAANDPGKAPPTEEPKKVIPAARIVPVAARSPDSISGSVQSPSGRGQGQARIALVGANGKEVASTTSAADGRYSFQNVAPGSYTLVASDPDFLYTAADPVTVAMEKGKAVEANLGLKRGTARVSGVVVDAANKPVADQQVIISAGSAGAASVSVNTDPKGRFLVNGLADGKWTVTPHGRSDLARTIQTNGPDTPELTIPLVKRAALKIRIVGTPLHPISPTQVGNAIAYLRPAGKTDDASTRSTKVVVALKDAEDKEIERDERHGAVEFKDLEPGQYELDVVDAKGVSVISGGAAWATPTPVTLEAGEERSWPLPTLAATRGLGVEVPLGAIIFMVVAIGLLIFVTPILFPAPVVPKRPANLPAAAPAPAPTH